MIEVTTVRGTLSPEQKTELSEQMTKVLLMIEGGADTPGGRAIAWVMYHEVEADTWAIGGKFDDTYVAPGGKFLVKVTVPEGSMNQTKKSLVHREVNDAIVALVGATGKRAGWSMWVQIHEIVEGHWGVGGTTSTIAGIAKVAGAAYESEGYRFVEDYFDAKQRVHEAHRYPPDTAGLLRQKRLA